MTAEQTATDLEMHDPELYRYDAVAEPLNGLESIGKAEVDLYGSQGFLAVSNAFPTDMIEAALEGWTAIVRGEYPEYNGFDWEPAAQHRIDEITVEERFGVLRKIMFFVGFEPRLKALSHSPELLDVVSRMIDAKPRMFQDMALSKPPGIGREKPWHQDCSYFDIPPGTPVVGVWIALDEATIENGCMHVMAGGHREGPIVHFQRRDWQICDDDLYRIRGKERPVIAVPLEPGGCLFFSGITPHGTPHNHSDKPRCALQYHYYPEDTQSIPTEERLAVFGEEGKDVSC